MVINMLTDLLADLLIISWPIIIPPTPPNEVGGGDILESLCLYVHLSDCLCVLILSRLYLLNHSNSCN